MILKLRWSVRYSRHIPKQHEDVCFSTSERFMWFGYN